MSADGETFISRRAALAHVSALLSALLTAACSTVEFVAANVPAALGANERRANIAYGTHAQQRLDVYLPERRVSDARPLVVFWHGGRWSSGDKAEYRFVGAALTEIDCVAVLPNYRHYPEVLMAGFMQDAAAAARWAAAHARDLGADPDRLYLMGHSAGAHMAALLTLDTGYFAAAGQAAPPIAGVIGLSGPYDFLPLLEADVREMFGPPDRYPDSQPINFVRRGAPPMLLMHGLRDDKVWPKNSRNLATALRALDVPVTLKLYPKLMHVDTVAALSTPARGRAPTLADLAAFIHSSDSQAALAAAGAAIA